MHVLFEKKIITGIAFTLSAVANFTQPLVAGYITSNDSSKQQYRKLLWISLGIATFCSLVHALLGCGEQQDWDRDEGERIRRTFLEVERTEEEEERRRKKTRVGDHDDGDEKEIGVSGPCTGDYEIFDDGNNVDDT